jgi:2-polyprenyl-6-methoxyphenol hydroxylase-like FAD-dependent oxidoreductase
MVASEPPAAPAPVIIIGGGPVGMVLALSLDALGVRCTLVNDEPQPRRLPKGGTQNSRTMEHYRRLGVAGAIRELGLPKDHPTDVVYFTRFNGWELQRLPMPSEREKMRARDSAEPTDQIVEPLLRCNQMHVEALLFEHLSSSPNVEMRFGWRCNGIDDHGDGVTVEIEEIASGQVQRREALYAVGCDGGQSFVRRRLDIHYGGENLARQAYLGGPMVSTYLRAPAVHERIIRHPGWQYWAVNSEVRSNTLAIDGAAELLFNTRLATPEDRPSDASVRQAFLASVGEPIEVEIIGHATWTAGQALVADRFGEGRILLAGDAAHLFTPTGGFGVNTGVDDAANMAWKLAALVQGWGGPRLLSSYELERRPIALRNTAAAKELASNHAGVPVGGAIEEDSPEGELERHAAGEYLSGFGREFASIGVQLGARYDGSPIVVADGTTPPPDDPITYLPSACPGGRAPHLWLDQHDSLFDHFGPGFTLIRTDGAVTDTSRLVDAARAKGVPLTLLDVTRPEARELYERNLALIRPDQHVAWRGDRLPDDCEALIKTVSGW